MPLRVPSNPLSENAVSGHPQNTNNSYLQPTKERCLERVAFADAELGLRDQTGR